VFELMVLDLRALRIISMEGGSLFPEASLTAEKNCKSRS